MSDPNVKPLRWESTDRGRQRFVDVDGLGRYLVRRKSKGSREFVALLNARETKYVGYSLDDVCAAVDKAVATMKAIIATDVAEVSIPPICNAANVCDEELARRQPSLAPLVAIVNERAQTTNQHRVDPAGFLAKHAPATIRPYALLVARLCRAKQRVTYDAWLKQADPRAVEGGARCVEADEWDELAKRAHAFCLDLEEAETGTVVTRANVLNAIALGENKSWAIMRALGRKPKDQQVATLLDAMRADGTLSFDIHTGEYKVETQG